ncbi:hypothetical protein SVIOM342S_04002 [Streptomyces violaceorubidus]
MVDGETKLVSNTLIGPLENTWLAGPQLGRAAEAMYQSIGGTIPAVGEPPVMR